MPFCGGDKYIFCSCGIDLTLEDWHETTDYKKVWLRKPFHEAENHTGKTIVFWATPVYGLLKQDSGTAELLDNRMMARLGWMEELSMVVSFMESSLQTKE